MPSYLLLSNIFACTSLCDGTYRYLSLTVKWKCSSHICFWPASRGPKQLTFRGGNKKKEPIRKKLHNHSAGSRCVYGAIFSPCTAHPTACTQVPSVQGSRERSKKQLTMPWPIPNPGLPSFSPILKPLKS